jgi:transposase
MARFSTASGGCEAAEHRGGDSRAQGELLIGPSGNVRVLVAMKPVDFRKGAEGLAALVRETMRTDPFSGVVHVFRAKRADRVKLIFWDGTGVVRVANNKRLENGKFSWPAIDNGVVMRLSAAQLQALLEGLDWRRVHESRRTTSAAREVPVDPPGQALVHAGAGAPCAAVGAFSNPARRLSFSR